MRVRVATWVEDLGFSLGLKACGLDFGLGIVTV